MSEDRPPFIARLAPTASIKNQAVVPRTHEVALVLHQLARQIA
jgi:hypothetical protein